MAFERCIADLEGGSAGFAFASGMAATATVLDCLEKNSHVVVGDDVYGGTRRLFNLVRSQSAGIEATYVDLSDPEALNGAIRPSTRLVWLETPTNPMLKVIDLDRIATIARAKRVLVACDNTFCESLDTAAVGTWLRFGHAFHHKVSQRTFRHGWRYRGRG